MKTGTQGEGPGYIEDWRRASTSQGTPEVTGKPPGAGRGKKGSTGKASEETRPGQHLACGHLTSGTETTHFCVFDLPISGIL